jgi:hypothetical protein
VGVAAAVEATRITMVHAAATAVQEAAAVRESIDLRVKDVEDQATLAEREALERVSRVEAENAVALVSAREDAEGFVRKISLLEGKLVEERRPKRCLRGSAGHNWRSSPFCRPRVLSYATPSSIPHG